MDSAKATKTIVRKFTNHLKRKHQNADGSKDVEAMKVAAQSLVNFKTYSHGKSVFKERKKRPLWNIKRY